MDNLSKFVVVEGKFYDGDKISNWNKYKYHFYNLIITTSNSGITHKQLPIFNTSRGFYNDNSLIGGSIALDIGADEIIRFNGSFPKINLHIRELVMFNWFKVSSLLHKQIHFL